MEKPKRAALLCRVSTVDKQSNERQVEELTNLARGMGYTIEPEDTYEDKISGYSKWEERPGLSKLIKNIKTKDRQYDIVFVMEVSRISRKPEEGQKILAEFTGMGVPIWVKNISLCTHIIGEYDQRGELKRNPMFNIVYTLLAEFAHAEAEAYKERTISGTRSAIKKGKMGTGAGCYGYKADSEKNFVIDEATKGVVEDVFNYALKGYGLKTICNILNEAGVPTFNQKKSKKGTIMYVGSGGIMREKKVDQIRWAEGTVQHMLTNTTYKGKRKCKIDVKYVDGKKVDVYDFFDVPAIIDEETFDRVQKLRSAKFEKRCVDMRYMYILKNLVICGICGRYMAGRYKNHPDGPEYAPTDAYYQCSSKRVSGQNCGCISPGIEALESTVWELVTKSPRFHEYLRSTGTELKDANEKMERLKDEVNFLEKQLVGLDKEKEKVKQLYRKEIYTEDEFDQEWKTLVKRTNAVEQKIQSNRKQITSLSERRFRLSNMGTYIEILAKVKQDRFQIADMLNDVLDKVVVTSFNSNPGVKHHVVSVFIKDLIPPITAVMISKMPQDRKSYDLTHYADETGQTRFLYFQGGPLGEDQLNYSDDNRLLSNPEKVFDSIKQKKWFRSGHTEKHRARMNDQFQVPVLIPFHDANAIDQVKTIKAKQKKKNLN